MHVILISRVPQIHHIALRLQKRCWMHTCNCVCFCACTCVMNDLRLAAVSIFFLLIILLRLHRPLYAGARGFVKSVSLVLTCTMPWEPPQASLHVNQSGNVFEPHNPDSSPTLVNTSDSLTFQLQEDVFNYILCFISPINIFILSMDQKTTWKRVCTVTENYHSYG